jgi:lysophospholipase L1-like esterase
MIYDINGKIINTSSNDSVLNGKKWLPIGDSITTQSSYRSVLSNYYGLTEISGGYAGGLQVAYSSGESSSILSKIDNIASGIPNIITIALGTNDYGNNCPIGEITDNANSQTTENYTFIGCYKKLIETLYEKYGNIPMVLLTPFPRNGKDNKNSANATLEDYANAIKTLGKYYSIPVCDMLNESGVPIGTLSELNGKYYTTDGLHLTTRTGRIVAPKIATMMNDVMNVVDVKCTSMGQSSTSYTLTNTDKTRIFVTLTPSGTTEEVVWESSNTNIVTVEAETAPIYANLKAVANGSATITATCGSITKTFEITVSL